MARTVDNGYGYAHRQERKRLIPIVRAQGATCAQPVCIEDSRWMPPGTEPHQWDLGHNDERTEWIGPCHVSCNRDAPRRARANPKRLTL